MLESAQNSSPYAKSEGEDVSKQKLSRPPVDASKEEQHRLLHEVFGKIVRQPSALRPRTESRDLDIRALFSVATEKGTFCAYIFADNSIGVGTCPDGKEKRAMFAVSSDSSFRHDQKFMVNDDPGLRRVQAALNL